MNCQNDERMKSQNVFRKCVKIISDFGEWEIPKCQSPKRRNVFRIHPIYGARFCFQEENNYNYEWLVFVLEDFQSGDLTGR